ncbi:MAG: hypothetical protein RQ833_11715 [Sphingomonadaceae bacterium]|nr:hypothetical protein [Sphingomonadaceae bacterium]
MADLFGSMGGRDSGPPPARTRRKLSGNACTRDLAAGPGSCWHWWEGCPERVEPCAARLAREVRPAPEEPSQWARENADRHFLAFAIVHADRYRTIAAAHDAWEAGVRA